jgi:3-(3-hydroxy-phenyl)propionate hydroxylase
MEKPEKVRELLAPWCKPEDMVIERTAVYRFHARIVNRFSKGRVFLAGDAAHITPPFVGQGLVAGLRDVANLSWKLAWVVHGHADRSILDSYDTERRPHAKAVINFALLMGRLVMPRNRLTAFCVHGLMSLVQHIPGARAFFEDLKIKPPARFGRGLFTKGKTRSKLARGGMLPQGLVRKGIDSPFVQSDDVLGPRLTLVGFGCDPTAQLDPCMLATWEQTGGAIIHLRHRGQAGTGEHSWEDMTDALVPGAAPAGWVAVVRPDRLVMHDGPLEEMGTIVGECLTLLRTDQHAHGEPYRAAGESSSWPGA